MVMAWCPSQARHPPEVIEGPQHPHQVAVGVGAAALPAIQPQHQALAQQAVQLAGAEVDLGQAAVGGHAQHRLLHPWSGERVRKANK